MYASMEGPDLDSAEKETLIHRNDLGDCAMNGWGSQLLFMHLGGAMFGGGRKKHGEKPSRESLDCPRTMP